MTSRLLASSLAALFLALPLAASPSASPDQAVAQPRAQAPMYGSQLMTRQERIEYRNKMHAAKTPEEREALRLEHHKLMQERAKAKGITLPDEPPARGMMGRGPGMDMGRDPGMGMGRDPGMGPRGPNRPAP